MKKKQKKLEIVTYPQKKHENKKFFISLDFKSLECPHCKRKSRKYYRLDEKHFMCTKCKGKIIFVFLDKEGQEIKWTEF